MFGFVGRRRLAVAGLVVAAVAAGVAVQASASGGSNPPKVPAVPKALSLKDQAAANQARVKAQATPATNVFCGETITATTTMNGDLSCPSSNGLRLDKNSITLNLGGHTISGTTGVGAGVYINSNSDTVENGYISGFLYGVQAEGASDTVTKLQVNYSAAIGIGLVGTGDKATSDTAAENSSGYGLYAGGSDETLQSNHLLNNSYGLVAVGGGVKVLTNIADGNTNDGLLVNGSLDTVTGNTANFNGGYGINATSPQIDGGTNKATGNTNSQQCKGVVCAPE
jgi:large repetitive protein